MSREGALQVAMEDAYRRAGREVGYWGNYFLRSVRKNGGLATAKRMLQPTRGHTIHKGLQALIDAGRPDLSLEALVLQAKFSPLFTEAELNEARHRLQGFAPRQFVRADANHPESVIENRDYVEGAVRRVLVNAYERDAQARAACLRRHGYGCSVCGMKFEKRYGLIGRGFIHVHHIKPLGMIRATYGLDPSRDLAPVCPNCHAMLHTSDPPLSVEELKRAMS